MLLEGLEKLTEQSTGYYGDIDKDWRIHHVVMYGLFWVLFCWSTWAVKEYLVLCALSGECHDVHSVHVAQVFPGMMVRFGSCPRHPLALQRSNKHSFCWQSCNHRVVLHTCVAFHLYISAIDYSNTLHIAVPWIVEV